MKPPFPSLLQYPDNGNGTHANTRIIDTHN